MQEETARVDLLAAQNQQILVHQVVNFNIEQEMLSVQYKSNTWYSKIQVVCFDPIKPVISLLICLFF